MVRLAIKLLLRIDRARIRRHMERKYGHDFNEQYQYWSDNLLTTLDDLYRVEGIVKNK